VQTRKLMKRRQNSLSKAMALHAIGDSAVGGVGSF
jgi:hypothetical protein